MYLSARRSVLPLKHKASSSPRSSILCFGFLCKNDDGMDPDRHQRDKSYEAKNAANKDDVFEEADLSQRLLHLKEMVIFNC